MTGFLPGDLDKWLPRALAPYDLDVVDVAEVRVTNNMVFRLDTPRGSCALRIHRPAYRQPQHIRSELEFVEALAEGSEVTVPRPIRTRHGDLLATVELDGVVCSASVVTWLDGEVRRPGKGAGYATISRIGQALGRIHRFSERFDPPEGFELPTWDLDTEFNRQRLELIATSSHRRLIDELVRTLRDHFAGLSATPQTFGVLHNDFILLNCLHTYRRTAVIDFDDSGWGFYLQDLGGLLGNLRDYGNYRTLRRWFIEGYESERPFPSADEHDLALVIARRHGATALWLHERHVDGAMTTDQFAQNLAYRIEEIESSLLRLTR